MTNIFRSKIEEITENTGKRIHNYYICKRLNCNDISSEEKQKMTKDNKFQHRWLFDPALGQCPHTGIWTLIFVEGQGMFCGLCRMHDTSQPTTGLKIWNSKPNVRCRQETIRLHYISPSDTQKTMHNAAVTTEKIKKGSYFIQEEQSKEKRVNDVYEKIFSVVYWLSKEEIALSKFNSLLQLLESLGLDDIKDFTTRSPFVVRNIAMELADVVKTNLVEKIKKSGAFAILTDEATDISNIQQLLTFLRYYDCEKKATDTSFVNASDLLSESETTSADAQSIYLSLKKLIEDDLLLDISHLQAFCSDGAGVMTGKKGGVAAKFKQDERCENMLDIHCICHRLALACCDSGDELKFVKEFELTMLQLWSFFKNSSKRLKTYIKVAMKMKEFDRLPKKDQKRMVKRVKKACRTRWLSLQAAVDSVYSEYIGILQTLRVLKDEAMPTGASAKGLLKKMNSLSFLSVLYMLKSMLPHLTALSKTFQKGELNFSRITPNIEKTKFQINQVSQQNEPVARLKEDLQNHLSVCEITINDEKVKSITKQYSDSIIKNSEKRFPKKTLNVLDAFSILNAEQFPADLQSQEFAVYGNDEIKLLCDHYQIGSKGMTQWNEFRFEMVQLHKKWLSFKSQIETNKMNVTVTPTEWSLKQIVNNFSEDENYCLIAKFAKTALIVPVSNAWPERGASTVKRVKTRMRSTMKNDLLNGLLHLSINGPTTNSNEAKAVITKAVEKYDSSRRHRRPNKSHLIMPTNPSIAVQVDLSHQEIINQMESCMTKLDQREEYVMQTNFEYELSSESESEDDDEF